MDSFKLWLLSIVYITLRFRIFRDRTQKNYSKTTNPINIYLFDFQYITNRNRYNVLFSLSAN